MISELIANIENEIVKIEQSIKEYDETGFIAKAAEAMVKISYLNRVILTIKEFTLKETMRD